MDKFIVLTVFILTLVIGFYLITTLQWFSYKIERVIFHFTKPLWHILFLIVPILVYYVLGSINFIYFTVYFYILYLPMLFFWHKKLDKKLVFTARVKRYFGFLVASSAVFGFLYLMNKTGNIVFVISPILIALCLSYGFEKIIFFGYKNKAMKKLSNMQDLTIIMITASYGKTSIKNFLYDVLSSKFSCYKTPRSVNTLGGLIKDINECLVENTSIYIAEAGARLKGDIDKIAKFLKPQIVVVGEIGPQHLEYFKSIENIRKTKLEALNSPRLKQAFLHSSTKETLSKNIVIYNENIVSKNANLSGLEFEMKFGNEIYNFSSPLLGEFNVENIAVCVHIAKFLGVSIDEITKNILKLKNVEHRLQKIEAGGKIIIDDGFNGNFKGMSDSYRLVSMYEGTKVLVTPGIIESNEEENAKLTRIMDEVFDIVIITGLINQKVLQNGLQKTKVFLCPDKTKLTMLLAKETKAGDLILFSNDAPSYI